MDGVDVAVIGAGVVGSAVAQCAAARGFSVAVLEQHGRAGTGITSRNSGVIHSGLYYAPGSLKARLCVRGQALLYEWCQQHPVWHRRCGKLVVAVNAQQADALAALQETAAANGATGLQMLNGAAARQRVPQLVAHTQAALWCPQTGVVDAVEFTQSLLADAENHGAMTLLNARVTGANPVANGWLLQTTRGPLSAAHVVNAAGLYADDVAHLVDEQAERIHPCRGDYFRWSTPHTFDHLVYPVKDPQSPGLGVHLTLDRQGGIRLGPDVTWVERKDDWAGGEDKRARFAQAASALFGPVDENALHHDGAGIRPKLRAPHETDEKDFIIRQRPNGFIHLLGMESPGLTASMAVAEHVVDMF